MVYRQNTQKKSYTPRTSKQQQRHFPTQGYHQKSTQNQSQHQNQSQSSTYQYKPNLAQILNLQREEPQKIVSNPATCKKTPPKNQNKQSTLNSLSK